MKNNKYIQPSVRVMEMQMVQTLCASGDTSTPTVTFSPIIPEATTNSQL